MFRNMISFYVEELLAPHPNTKLEVHTLAVVLYCLFNIFPTTLRPGGRSSSCKLRTRHAVVTGTYFIREVQIVYKLKCQI